MWRKRDESSFTRGARWRNWIRLTELAIETVLRLFNIIRTSERSCKRTYRNPCRADPCRRCNGSPRIRPDVSSPTPPACNGRSRGSHSSNWARTWSPCTPCTTFWWGSSCNIPTNDAEGAISICGRGELSACNVKQPRPVMFVKHPPGPRGEIYATAHRAVCLRNLILALLTEELITISANPFSTARSRISRPRGIGSFDVISALRRSSAIKT